MPQDGNQSRIVAGRYRLASALGSGAQGAVYLAEDLGRGGTHVALKLVEEVVGGPREEPADALLRHFRHPNWAAVLDAGRTQPEGWFQVVELVRGTSLDRLAGPQPIEHVWKLLEDGARVLGAMHRQGLLHYDVTPGNVMLDESAAEPRFVLTDGGLAHIGPVEGVARGTPMYMAPEVTEVGAHDHRADLYSLGLVAFRLATGRDPIEGQGSEVLGRRRREDAPRARSLQPDLPTALDDLLASLLARAPQARPHDAFDLLDKLAAARETAVPRFTHAEGVAAAEGGALVGATDALARVRGAVSVLEARRRGGPSRLAAVRAPKLDDPVLLVHGRTSSGATRVASEAFDLARACDVPALLMSGRDAAGDRRGPLRRLLDGMAALERAPGEPIEELHLDLARQRELGREERSHALTRAVEQFLRAVEITAKRTPFLLVVQDFAELTDRAKEAVRVLSRHLIALADQGGSAAAPPVVLLVDVGDEEPHSLLVPDTDEPERPLLDTPPLTPAEVLTFMSARFPGIAPDETDLDRIHTMSEGLPGILAVLMAEGSRRGDLVYEAGQWSWNVDGLDGYELRTGLSPMLAEALANADENLLQLLAYLSLVEAPLDETIVKKLWSLHSSDPIPSTPLIRVSDNGSLRRLALPTRVRSHTLVQSRARDSDARSHLAGVLARGTPAAHVTDLAKLHLEGNAHEEAMRLLATRWPDLTAGQRSRSQAMISSAVHDAPAVVRDERLRESLSRMLEYGGSGADAAQCMSADLTDSDADARTALRLSRVLGAARRETEALRALDISRGARRAHHGLTAELETRAASLLLNLHRPAEAQECIRSAKAALRAERVVGRRDWAVMAEYYAARAQLMFLDEASQPALRCLRAARRCARHARSPGLLARIYSNMGIVENQLHRRRTAIRRLSRALALRKQLGDVDGTLSTLSNLARLHQQDGELVKSAALFQDAASRAQRHAQHAILGRSLLFLGRVYDQQLNARLAASTLHRASQVAVRANARTIALLAAWELAPLAAALGDLPVAHDMLKQSALAARERLTAYARGTHYYVAGLVGLHVGDDRRAAHCFNRAAENHDSLYPWRQQSLQALRPLLRLLGVGTWTQPIKRPQREGSARFAYRTGLWIQRALLDRPSPTMPPIERYLPRPGHATAASGEDRRVLAEAVLRMASKQAGLRRPVELAGMERVLALTGERYVHGRLLAVRSIAGSGEETAESAQLFSRAVELVDVPTPIHTVSGYPLPQEHRRAHAAHAASLGDTNTGTYLRARDSHALAHRLLLRHGYSAAPDGRISSALRRVLAATGRMNAGAGLDDLLQGMTEDTIEITGAERACVVLIDPNSAQQMRVEKGTSSENLGVEVEDLSQTVIQRVIDAREPLLLHDVFDDQELMGRPSITSLSLRSILCVPMLRGETLFGVLYADSASAAGSFDHVDQEVLSLFAEQAAAALETHRLVADVQNSMAELKAMQERLVRGERLRTMGELSSGVAHEFNNLLTSILARVQLISLEPVGAELKHDLDLIEKACLDAAEVVRRLQSFTRREREEDFTRVDLKEVCNDAVEFLRPLWSTRRRHGRAPVTVKVRTDEHLPVQGNATELREVVTNLLKNSLDALADGGHIDIEARAIPGGITLRFEDNGPGIPDDVQARVFDPFFTTKGERGTGLGLCLSQQIIERHGGEMALWSEQGKGTRFTIELPLAESAGSRAATQPQAQPLRVLVVDDDENVRVPLCRFLKRSGYETESAATGEDALEVARGMHPDVIISDVAMPGMNGIDLCEQLKKESPDVPVILMSGWTSGTDPSRARRAGAVALLKKPFALQQVEAALRAAAGDAAGAAELRRLG